MVHVVASRTNLSEIAVTDQFKRVFMQAGTLDFRNLIQNLELAQSLSEEQRQRLVNDGRRAYDLSKRKRLLAYEGLNDVFQAVRQAGVKIVGVTNAPFYHAFTRLRDVG